MSSRPMIPREHPFVKAVAAAVRRRCGVVCSQARIVVAVSGGADSVALLRALAAIADRRTWKLELTVGHVQHHLRTDGSAEADAAFVATLAKQLDLPFVRADLHKPARVGNIEAWARAARYGALAEMASAFDAPFIATAHHADDQLETLLMRLLRGTSVRGLGGIAWKKRVASCELRIAGSSSTRNLKLATRNLSIIRPMLAVDRAAVRKFLNDIDQPWREDQTNTDLSRLRARLREDVLPVLRDIRGDAPRRAVALADHLRQISRLLDRAVTTAAERVDVEGNKVMLDRVAARAMEPVVLSGLLRRLLNEAGVGRDRLGNRFIRPIVRAVRDTTGGKRVFKAGGGSKVTVTRDTVTIWRR